MKASPFYTPKTLLLGGKLVSLDTPLVMGVINVTNDSFYPGSCSIDAKEIFLRAKQIVSEGASVVDLGAMSSRPGAKEIAPKVEINRLVMACDTIRTYLPDTAISIDTFRSEVLQALEPFKINMVNDISGGQDDESIWDWAAEQKVPYVLMHRRGNALNMQHLTDYGDIVKEILDYFIHRIPRILEKGVHDIIIDPGIGFAKTMDQNFYLLQHLHNFQILELPMLVGVSRKSLIWKVLDISPEQALNGTTALHMHALTKGVQILRVHDVKEAMQTISLWKKIHP